MNLKVYFFYWKVVIPMVYKYSKSKDWSIVVCDLLVTQSVYMGFQRIFNYRSEHLILVKPLCINRLYLEPHP